MENERKQYSRYFVNRGIQVLWKGDAAESGSQFVEVVITSNEWNSTEGTFQVCALEGIGNGLKDGSIVISQDDTKILYDNDFQGFAAAEEKFKELVEDAQANGFDQLSTIDVLEFDQKARESKSNW